MSVAAELHDRYRDVRRRLMGKPQREVSEKIEEAPEPDKLPYWRVLQERKKAHDRAVQQSLDAAIIRASGAAKTPSQLLITRVALKHDLTYHDIVGLRRNRKVITARFEAMKLVHETYPNKSLTELGRIFKRDHTSLRSALRKIGCYTKRKS